MGGARNCLCLAVLACLGESLWAQGPLSVAVTERQAGSPVAGAVLMSGRTGLSARTDRLGRARFASLPRPDTVFVAAIGFRPETVLVDAAQSWIDVTLSFEAITLAELTVTPGATPRLAPSIAGDWRVPGSLIGALPAAVEADPLRALAVVPAVSFSSPLSARPIIRGYDAAEGVVRIDGFEIVNPFHLGRIFSAFPAEGVGSATVVPLPSHAAQAGTLGGAVELGGKGAPDMGSVAGGIELSLVSATGWMGLRTSFPAFAVARAAFLQAATDLVANEGFPYNFQDGYGHTTVGLGDRRSVETTIYGSRDHLGERSAGAGMDWSNALLGQRWRLMEAATGTLDLNLSVNSFSLRGNRLAARSSLIDVSNDLDRAAAELQGTVGRGAWAVQLGGGATWRRLRHELRVLSGDDFTPAQNDSRLVEYQGFLETSVTAGRFQATGGVRLDASSTALAWQPRARVSVAAGQHVVASLSLAGASRLYQTITDPQPEPSVTFYDFWYVAGEGAIPVPYVTHLAADVDAAFGAWSVHGAAFASFGHGLGELRPVYDQRSGLPPLRFGQARTRGVEARAAVGRKARGPAAALSYVLSYSERRWEDGVWRPWRLDRRHLLRLEVQESLGSRWRAFATAEAQTGQPLTEVADVVIISPPLFPQDSSIVRGRLGYRYGPEGQSRSGGTVRGDFGLVGEFRGPMGSRVSVGLSVINAIFGPVAPDVPVDPSELLEPDGTYSSSGVRYERLFRLPPVPSVLVRVEF